MKRFILQLHCAIFSISARRRTAREFDNFDTHKECKIMHSGRAVIRSRKQSSSTAYEQ
jgi:hypothetical protein